MPKGSGFKVLSKIDVFGAAPEFNFGGEQKSKTACGGFLTLLILTFLIWNFITSGRDLFERQEPSVIVSDTILQEIGQVQLGKGGQFDFGFSLMDWNYVPIIDPSIYTFSAYLVSLDGVEFSYERLELEFCDEDYGFQLTAYCVPSDIHVKGMIE